MTERMVAFIIGLFVGGNIGFIFAAIMATVKRGDK